MRAGFDRTEDCDPHSETELRLEGVLEPGGEAVGHC